MVKSTYTTKETDITIRLKLKGNGNISVDTGIGFFDHMLTTLAFWSGWDLSLTCKGDLHIDTHHTVEDVGLALGKVFYQSWSENKAIERISYVYCPMDEALTRVVVDICNRPYLVFQANFDAERVGDFETYMTDHFFRSFAQEARITLHIQSLYGTNVHHIIESMFKGMGIALQKSLKSRGVAVSSVKGSL